MTRRNPLTANPNAITLASAETAPPLLFDYDQIAHEHRSPLMLAARRIKMKGQRIKTDLLDIGKELTEAKQRLPHGQFGDWLSVEFDMSDRSARHFMQVYQVYGSKSETVSVLNDSALYLLSAPSVTEEAREQAEDEAKATGRSPTKARVQAIIAAHKPPVETQNLVSPHAQNLASPPINPTTFPTADTERRGDPHACPPPAPDLLATLGEIQAIDFQPYSNLTGDWTTPNRLRNLLDVMIRTLEGTIQNPSP